MAHRAGPNLGPKCRAIEPDSSRQQIPEKRQRQETPSTSSTVLPFFIHEREEDQQQEDHHSNLENYLFKEISYEYDSFNKLFKVQYIDSRQQFILELIAHHESLCLPSIENTSNLQPVTSTTASAQDSPAANVSPNNNSSVGITYNTGAFIMWFQDKLKESKDDEKKTDLFIDIMKLYLKLEKLIIPLVEADEPMQSLFDKHQKKHSRKEKQYAFAIVFFKDGKTEISSLFYPRHSTKRSHSDSIIRDTLHSEEILIKNIDNLFQNNVDDVQHVFIYTHNSPCMKREKTHIDPCMFLLRKKADQWLNKYGISTTVAFKRFWGQSHPNYFNYVTDISSPSSVFYPYTEQCDSMSFKLDFKKLTPGEILNLTDVEVKKRPKLCKDIESVLTSLKELTETTFGLKTDHVERGERMIVQSLENFQDLDIGIKISKTLREKWVEMVNNSFLSLIRETITADFKTAQVHLAVEDLQLGDNSPLQLYHILDRNQNMLN
ncbi:uncharacterized protein LOC115569180 [Sparus aurata]|uniref:uncharacterized protein LOC115569180 n=1 Tax=Sparus aurata TaxID=8175 RepID=UPI0011C1C596|nr:uncharacterized protein LOC115569180 [Sparus aurata]